ncbi:MAG TPA: hypothetical protein VMM38_01450 [Aridibacter sp.]|nr:hypothetical protein [Aridibacter sp.]
MDYFEQLDAIAEAITELKAGLKRSALGFTHRTRPNGWFSVTEINDKPYLSFTVEFYVPLKSNQRVNPDSGFTPTKPVPSGGSGNESPSAGKA